MRKTSQNGINLIKTFEGFSPMPYHCPAGILTIGYGHTGSDVMPNMHITKEQGEELLLQDIRGAESAVSRLITRPLTDNQFAALVDFVFNLGAGVLQASTLRAKCNRRDDDDLPHEFMRYVWGGGRKLSGLVKRRRAEANLYALA